MTPHAGAVFNINTAAVASEHGGFQIQADADGGGILITILANAAAAAGNSVYEILDAGVIDSGATVITPRCAWGSLTAVVTAGTATVAPVANTGGMTLSVGALIGSLEGAGSIYVPAGKFFVCRKVAANSVQDVLVNFTQIPA